MKNIILTFIFVMSFNKTYTQNLIYGVENKIIWGKENTKDITLPLDFKTQVRPNQLLIGYNSPSGTKFYFTFKNLNNSQWLFRCYLALGILPFLVFDFLKNRITGIIAKTTCYIYISFLIIMNIYIVYHLTDLYDPLKMYGY